MTQSLFRKQEVAVSYCKTPMAAAACDCTYWELIGLLRSGRLTPPAKDSSGDYVWTPEDVERARAALRDGRRPGTGGRKLKLADAD
jgi:hypothetical protein